MDELLPIVKTIIVCDKTLIDSRFTTIPIYLTTEENIKKISGVAHPEKIIAEVCIPPFQSLHEKNKIIVLDSLQDPGNVGTLMRSALAFGFDGMYLIEPIVDPYNDKVIRSSKGAVFSLPLQRGSLDDFIKWALTTRATIFRADLKGKTMEDISSNPTHCTILILGNESKGIDDAIKQISIPITIPISDKTESLNVAIAGSILMYSLGQHHVR
ncbi:MAG: RNA methyltransferase [Chlamydiales bacterium]|nr:RNA methyltransferase [Chlamydiales bacterium]